MLYKSSICISCEISHCLACSLLDDNNANSIFCVACEKTFYLSKNNDTGEELCK